MHVLALVWVGNVSTPELLGERGEAVLRRPDPLAADLHDLAVAEVLVQQPAADAIARLEHDHRGAAGQQVAGRHEAREPGADDGHVGLAQCSLAHRATVSDLLREAVPYRGPSLVSRAMSSRARSTREEERRINLRTLAIASAASASAAVITSQFWINGTPYAAALTPVIVAVVSEMLHRPTEKIAERFTVETDALPEAAGAGPPPPSEENDPRPARAAPPATPRRAGSGLTGGPDSAPVKVYRQPSKAGVRARRNLPWKTILATAALAFVIAAAALTLPELIAGQSLGKGNGRTSILGNNRKSKDSDQQQEQPATTPEQTTPQTTTPAETTPQTTTPAPKKPSTTTPGGAETTPRTTPAP